LAGYPFLANFGVACPLLAKFGQAYPFSCDFWPDLPLQAIILLSAAFFIENSLLLRLQVSSGFAIRAVRE
jgi:hypothetical protein